ncbi:hypothetical protein ABZ621_25035 [Streptomyces sp. NPDC007863]|uniref:hypothetical protein n=1 Tax=Streptomyces sp. NPDC007863 TaxID=3154894 RepID=UPI0033E96514
MNDIRTRAEALIAADRPAEARDLVRDALDTGGPDAGLCLVLARAHLAEDDDDHDAAAESVLRDGLDAFPDDIGLLGEYAELGARSDGFDHPGRRARGERALDRLRELAPHSAELRSAEAAGGAVSAAARDAVSIRRMQSFDTARAFADAPTPAAAAARTAQWAAAAPHDRRLAVLAETTAVLAAPGRAGARLLLLRGLEYRLAVGVLVVLLVILRLTVVPEIPLGVATGAGLLLELPFLGLRRLLRDARDRAADRLAAAVPEAVPREEEGADGGFGAPELPPVPRFTRREGAFAGAAAALLLLVGGASYAAYTAYPRYELVSHDEFRGARGVDLGAVGGPTAEDGVEDSVLRMYGSGSADGSQLVVYAAVGDFHQVRAEDVSGRYGMLGGLKDTADVREDWDARAGARGGWTRCARVVDTAGLRKAVCMWADKGSLGSVAFVAEHMGRAGIEELAADVREAFVRPAGG